MKFTFKTTKPTGRYRSFESALHDIKLNKKIVGSILDKVPYTIGFTINKKDIMENGNPNCCWRWVRLKKEFTSLQEAKDFLNANIDRLLKQFDLHPIEY